MKKNITLRSISKVLILFILSFTLGQSAAVQASGLSVTVQEVNQKINAQHAGWSAKENWVTQLPREQIERMLGMQNPPQPEVEFMATEASSRRMFALPVAPTS